MKARWMNLCVVVGTLALAAGARLEAEDGLVGRWSMDEGSGTNTVDASGNGRTGTLIGNPAPVWTSGVSSNALLFDGIQNEMQVSSEIGLTPTNAISLAAWVKLATNATGEAIAKWDTQSSTGSYMLSLTNGLPALELSLNGDYVQTISASPLPDSLWHHLAGTYDGEALRVYLDGALQGTTSASGTVDVVEAPVRIGLPAGRLDDVRIYYVALTATQLVSLVNADTDGDGMPDQWEVNHGLNPNNPNDANLDADNDGFTNLQEYLAGTNPQSALSRPARVWTGASSALWNVAGNWSPSGVPASGDTLVFDGSATMNLSNSNNLTGLTLASVNLLSGGYTLAGNSLAISTNLTLTFNQPGTSTISSALTGSGSVTKTGSGLVIFTGANTYTGATTVNDGTLQIGAGATAGSIAGGSTVSIGSSGIVKWNNNNSTAGLTLANVITGAGVLLLQGQNATNSLQTSVYTLSGNNTGFTGVLSLNGSILWNTTAQSRVGGAFIEAQALATMAFNGGTFNNNIVIQPGAGWHHNVSGDVVIGAIRLEGNNTLSGSITLNNTNRVVTGNSTGLNCTIGGWSAGTHHLMGVLSGPGDFAMSRFTSWNGGSTQAVNIYLDGTQSNTYTGYTVVDGQGSVASLWLNKTGGATAIAGGTTVQMGSGTGGQANLRMGQNQQFDTSNGGVVMSFINASAQWMRFDLKGTTQTLAGLNAGATNTQAGAVIQNQGIDAVAPAGAGTLTLIGSGTYLYNGYIRDQDNSGTTYKLNLVVNGAGNQIVAGGAVSYTGSTVVNSGTLTLRATSAFNSPVTFNGGALVLDATGGDTILGQAISGTATTPVQINGANANWVRLKQDSPYTGGWLVNSNGWLMLGNNTTAGSVSGVVTNNGILGIYRNDAYTFTNNVVGKGALNLYQPGNNAVTLIGNNIVLGGSFNVFNGAGAVLTNVTVASGALWVNTGAVLTIRDGTSLTCGSFSQGGNSASVNMWGGSLFVTNNVLRDGWDQSFNITQTSGVVRATGLTFGGGGGSTRANTYSLYGGTLVLGSTGIQANYYYGGSLQVNLGGGTLSASASFPVVNNGGYGYTWLALNLTNVNGNATFDTGTNTVTLSQSLIGVGGFTKAGAGTLTIAGGGNYTGSTAISTGTVVVTSSLTGTGTWSVANGAVLAGQGTLSGSVTSSGTVSPGSLASPGTMHLVGNYTQTSSGNLAIRIGSSSSFDQLSVGGTAALNGALTVQLVNGFTPNAGVTFRILSDASCTGLFAVNNLPALSTNQFWQVLYDATGVTLKLTGVLYFTSNPLLKPSASVGLSYSDSLVGNVYNSLPGDALTFTKVSGPAWLTVGTNGALSGTPAVGDVGTNSFTVGVSSSSGMSTNATVLINVNSTPNGSTVVLTPGATWTVDANNVFIQNGVISGPGALTKTGPGILVLGGDNTYTGGTLISGGILQVGNGGSAGTLGTGIVTNNATLTFDRSDNHTFSGTLRGTGTVIQNGPGNLTLSGSGILYTGSTLVNAGTLTLKATSAFNSPVSFDSGALVLDSTGGDAILAQAISGAATVPVLIRGANANWVRLTSDSPFAGGWLISSNAWLMLGNNTVAGSVLGVVTNNGVLGIYHSNAYALTNNVVGTGVLSLYQPGGNLLLVTANTINLSALNGYAGTLSNTTVNLTGNLNFGGGTGQTGLTIQDGANVTVAGLLQTIPNSYNNQTLKIYGGTLTASGYFADAWDTSYAVTQTGGVVRAAGMTFGSGGGSSRVNTYNLYGGTLVLGSTGIQANYYYGGNLQVNLGGGTLSAGQSFPVINNGGYGYTWLALNLTNVNGNVTFDTGTNTMTVYQSLSGSGGLIKEGSGTLTLVANNDYVGPTTVNAGTMVMTSHAGTGTVAVAVAGTLLAQGTLSGAVNSSGTIALSADTSTERLQLNGDFAQSSTGTFQVRLNSTSTCDQLAIQGTANLDGNMTVQLVNGYVPMPGDSFRLIEAGTVSGQFAATMLPALTIGQWSVSYDATGMTLTVGGMTVTDDVFLTGSQTTTNLLGQWIVDGTDIYAVDRRGSVEYAVAAPTGDVYVLTIEGAQNLAGSPSTTFDLILSMDGVSLGRHTLTAVNGASGTVRMLTPFLTAGTHTVGIFWDNAASYTSLRIKSVKLQSISGDDTNGNGVKDWVENLIASDNSILTGTNSYTSPAFVEGNSQYVSQMVVSAIVAGTTTNLSVNPAPNNHWYTNVPLSTNGASAVTVFFENGGLVQTQQVNWVAKNVLDGGAMTIRKGDSLLLTAAPIGSTNGAVTFTIGASQYSTTPAAPVTYLFATAGVFSVTGSYNDGTQNLTGMLTVTVAEYAFTSNPIGWLDGTRTWDLKPEPSGVVLEADAGLVLQRSSLVDPQTQRWSLTIQQQPTQYVAARAGTNGAVLAVGTATGFRFWSSDQASLQVIEQYPDGSDMVEMMVVLSPVPPDISIQYHVFAGGVTFEDGTTYKTLTASDFDELGQCRVRFLRAASHYVNMCHHAYLYQNGVYLGGY